MPLAKGATQSGALPGVCPATAQNGRQDAREGTLPAGAPWKALPRKKGSAFQKPRSRAAFERQAPDGEKKPLSSLAKRDPAAAFCRPQPGFSKGSLDLDRLLGREQAFCGVPTAPGRQARKKKAAAQEAGFCRAAGFCSLKSRRETGAAGPFGRPCRAFELFFEKGARLPGSSCCKTRPSCGRGMPNRQVFSAK